MKRREWHGQALPAHFPLRLLGEHTVSDVAQRTVPSSDSGADPVGDFTNDCGVGIIDPDEFRNASLHNLSVRSVRGQADPDCGSDWLRRRTSGTSPARCGTRRGLPSP